ncbi:MAG: indolepyruvate oxidoreductase subunit beta [Bacillota bacterium]
MKNIMVAGVGGQGLVLATKIIAEAALQAGLDVKTNDVVGLSQRGGMVWGSARVGEKVNSPNIPVGEGDILLGMEPLEAMRWKGLLRKGALIVINEKRTYPSPVLLEKVEYPEDEIEAMEKDYTVIKVDAAKEAKEAGNIKAANTIMLGILAKHLDIDVDVWEKVLVENVPPKAKDANIEAFKRGYNYQ